MYIKSYMFRSQMRDLFIANFAALKSPAAHHDRRSAGRASRSSGRCAARPETIEYRLARSDGAGHRRIRPAEPVWHSFQERAITYNFENIFLNMIAILHFVYDVKSFKAKHPHAHFVHEAAKRTRPDGDDGEDPDGRDPGLPRLRDRAQGEEAGDASRR